jgi:CHAT domain-containing protein
MILKPVQEYSEAESVIVVSAGSLQSLPFSAIWDGQHYAIQSHAMSLSPSATVLALLRSEEFRKDDHTFLGVAAWTGTKPSLIARFLRGGPELDSLTPLPASLNEVSSIAADFPRPTDILAGSTATETEFKKLPLHDYRVIHLALHGYVDPLFPDRSALVFAPESSSDDGLLQVREIQNLHLNASLVTLSACDSAVGPLQDAGVNSLSNAFLDAGAKSVVSSLWDVDDHATAQLMIAFYTSLAHGEGKAEALRHATLHLIDGVAPQPFYWAAFQLSGKPASSLTREELRNSQIETSREGNKP